MNNNITTMTSTKVTNPGENLDKKKTSARLTKTGIKALPKNISKWFFNVDLRKETAKDKKKAIILYKTIKKSFYPVTALSLVALFSYTGVANNLPSISLQNNALSVNFSSPVNDLSSKKLVSSLAADENILSGNIDTNIVTTPIENVGKTGKFKATGTLKNYFKVVNWTTGWFFAINSNWVTKVIFPKIKDAVGKEFTKEDIATYVKTLGVVNPDVSIVAFPSIVAEVVKNMDTLTESEKEDFVNKFNKSIKVNKKHTGVSISKKVFGNDYAYYEDFLNEVVEIYSSRAELSN